jgi:aspartyl-tRNA synthetase
MTCPRIDDVVATGEGMMAEIYRRVLGVELRLPFLRLPYAEAMERFGVDKPDMRFAMELEDLSAAFAGTQFKVFAEVLARGESIYGLVLPAAYQLSRRELDEMTEGVRSRYGLGLAYAKIASDGWQGPIARHLGDAEKNAALVTAGLAPGDTLLMVAGASDPGRFASSARQQVQAARDRRVEISLGGRISAARVQRRGEADGRGEPSVHRAASGRPRPAELGPAERARARLRHGAQRRGVGRRLDPYP